MDSSANFGYLGQYGKITNGGTSQFIQMGARLYLPTLNRFAQVDPVYGGNTNSYTYPNDPVNDTDLNGESQHGSNDFRNTGFSPEKQKRIDELANKKGRTTDETNELRRLTDERKGKRVTQAKGRGDRPSRQTKDKGRGGRSTISIPYRTIGTYTAYAAVGLGVGVAMVIFPEVTVPVLVGGAAYGH